jgi:hypothetical protein
VYSVLEVGASRQAETPAIGTLNEGARHAQLKDWYRRQGDRIEQVVDGFVVDLVRGNLLSARRSPRRGRVEDIFNLLVSIPSLLCCPRFELELILTHQDELRVYRQGQAYHRRGWVVVGRRLVSVERSVRIASPSAAASLLPPGLPELFDTAQLAEAASVERRLAQQMTYCLRAMGALDTAGKRGNAILHRRVESQSDT